MKTNSILILQSFFAFIKFHLYFMHFRLYICLLLTISQEFLYLTIRSMTLQLVRFINNYKIFNFYDNKT